MPGLYDNHQDPQCCNNLAAASTCAAKVAELDAKITRSDHELVRNDQLDANAGLTVPIRGSHCT